jgi:hypothetical protein
MTSIPSMEENIIQGIDDNYSRHEGHILKAGRKSIPDMKDNIIQGIDDNLYCQNITYEYFFIKR